MVLCRIIFSEADPMSSTISFLHRYSVPSKGLAVLSDFQKDTTFGDFKHEHLLRDNAIPAYRKSLADQRPNFDQVSTTYDRFRILYDRVIFPEVASAGDPSWCLSLLEVRFVLEMPDPRIVLDLDEIMVLQMMQEGDSAREIGAALGLSPRTVEGRIERLKRKFGARNAVHLVALSVAHATDLKRWPW